MSIWPVPLKGEDLSKVVGRVKSLTARDIGRSMWQSGLPDHALRREEDIRSAARYIVANPVRPGLVDGIGLDPHRDAIWL